MLTGRGSGDSRTLHHHWERTERGGTERPRANENNIWPKLLFLTQHLVFLFQRPLAHNENELIPIRKSFLDFDWEVFGVE